MVNDIPTRGIRDFVWEQLEMDLDMSMFELAAKTGRFDAFHIAALVLDLDDTSNFFASHVREILLEQYAIIATSASRKKWLVVCFDMWADLKDSAGLPLISSPRWGAIQGQNRAILQDSQILLTYPVRLPKQHS